MDRVFDTRTIKGIKSALSSMSGELDELYREALVRIQKQAGNDGELGMRILSWITHAKRPLSVNELRYGLAVEYGDVPEHLEEFDEDNLLSPGSLVDVCAGLVIIDSNSQAVRLVHYTTQEYLDKGRMQLFKGAEVDISRACITYLSYNSDTEYQDEEIRDELIEIRPFLHYACHHWFSHAKNVLLSENPETVFVKALTRFKSSDSIKSSVHLSWRLSSYNGRPWLEFLDILDRKKEAYPYEVAAVLGLKDLMDVLVDRRIGLCPSLDSSFVCASTHGHLNVARLLLQHGATIDATLPYEFGGTLSALEGACREGNLAVVEWLIENGADIHGINTALDPPTHIAAMSRNLDIIDLLLKKGVNVNARNSRGGTACHVAVTDGSIESTRRLIDAGCDLELRDNNGNTVLLAYVESIYSNVETTDLLLDRGADPWLTWLSRIYFNVKIFDLLLDRGANACAKNKEGKTSRNIIEDRLEEPDFSSGNRRHRAEQMVEMLRKAEQKSSTTATNHPHQSEPTSSAQTVSHTSTTP